MIIVNWIESLPLGGILVLLIAMICAGLALIAIGKQRAGPPPPDVARQPITDDEWAAIVAAINEPGDKQ